MLTVSQRIIGKNVFSVYGIPDLFPKAPDNSVAAADKPTRVEADDNKVQLWVSSLDIAPWGTDNQFPQKAKVKFEANSLAMSLMKFRIDAHFGKGIRLYQETVNPDNTIKKSVILNDERWNSFAKRNSINKFQARLISDWEWWRNQFVEIILSNDGKTINRVYRQPAMFCRWKRLNPVTFKPDLCYVSSQWSDIQNESDINQIECLDWDDPIQDLRDYIKADGKQRRFILPLKLEESDSIYYDKPYWSPLLDTWLPLSTQVAYVKQALLKNQMVLKFHIKIPVSYWPNKYPGWNDGSTYDLDQKRNAINETLDEMNEFLTNTDNYGKSFISSYGADPINTSLITEEIKIEPIDNSKIKDGAHNVDGQHANSEIATGLGVDPALIGGQLPGGGEAGSGSNKREGFWIHQAKSQLDRMMTTQWFDHVKDYNGWPDNWKIGYEDIDTSQTLNENPNGKKDVL